MIFVLHTYILLDVLIVNSWVVHDIGTKCYWAEEMQEMQAGMLQMPIFQLHFSTSNSFLLISKLMD